MCRVHTEESGLRFSGSPLLNQGIKGVTTVIHHASLLEVVHTEPAVDLKRGIQLGTTS